MPVLSMEATSDRSSSLSAEEDAPSDKAGHPRADRGAKRRQRNRNAARKSRQKTTERADELHEELQSLEQDNSALEKEIKALQKELDFYTSALEKHKPQCCLNNKKLTTNFNTNGSSSAPASVPPQTCSTITAPAPSLYSFSTSSQGLHILSHPETFSTAFTPAPHSLFSEGPNPGSLLPPTAINVQTGLKMVEKLSNSQSPSCFLHPVTYSTSDDILPCSSMLSSPHDLPMLAQVNTGPSPSLTLLGEGENLKPPDLPQSPPQDNLLTALSPVDDPHSSSHLDTPFPPQTLFSDPRDLSLVQLLEDNDWILNVE